MLGLFLFYVAFRLHSFILRFDALFFIHQSTPQHKPIMAGTCFGKAHPNQYQSTPQPLPKHILRVCFWCLLGRALAFVGMCFPECALVLPECALASTGVCFANGWGPKKIQNESTKYAKTCSHKNKKLFQKCQKSIGFTAFKPLHFEPPPKSSEIRHQNRPCSKA